MRHDGAKTFISALAAGFLAWLLYEYWPAGLSIPIPDVAATPDVSVASGTSVDAGSNGGVIAPVRTGLQVGQEVWLYGLHMVVTAILPNGQYGYKLVGDGTK